MTGEKKSRLKKRMTKIVKVKILRRRKETFRFKERNKDNEIESDKDR